MIAYDHLQPHLRHVISILTLVLVSVQFSSVEAHLGRLFVLVGANLRPTSFWTQLDTTSDFARFWCPFVAKLGRELD